MEMEEKSDLEEKEKHLAKKIMDAIAEDATKIRNVGMKEAQVVHHDV